MGTSENKIAIIGFGHMGEALFKGLIKSESNKGNIYISDCSDDNKIIVPDAEWIIVSVRPLIVKKVLEEIKNLIKNKIIISVAAGVSIENIREYVGNKNQKVIRLMPNLAVDINSGIIGFYSSSNISRNLASQIKKVLAILGSIVEVKTEKELDNLMLISACGPAITCYFMEIYAKSAQKIGLNKEISHRVVLEMVKGTLSLLEKNKLSFSELKDLIATKGGITQEILKSMTEKRYEDLFFENLQKGSSKLEKLKNELK